MPNLPRPPRKPAPSGWARGKTDKPYRQKAWKKLRAVQLQESPLCEMCRHLGILTDCTTGGHVDHIIRIDAGGAFLDLRNLWTLCAEHHARKTAMERHCLTLDSTGPEGEKIPAPGTLDYLKKKLA